MMGTYIILINIGSSLHDPRTNHKLLPSLSRFLNIPTFSGNLSGNGSLHGVGEVSETCGVDHGGDGSGSVGCDDVECT